VAFGCRVRASRAKVIGARGGARREPSCASYGISPTRGRWYHGRRKRRPSQRASFASSVRFRPSLSRCCYCDSAIKTTAKGAPTLAANPKLIALDRSKAQIRTQKRSVAVILTLSDRNVMRGDGHGARCGLQRGGHSRRDGMGALPAALRLFRLLDCACPTLGDSVPRRLPRRVSHCASHWVSLTVSLSVSSHCLSHCVSRCVSPTVSRTASLTVSPPAWPAPATSGRCWAHGTLRTQL
jgi:hypothetical protein